MHQNPSDAKGNGRTLWRLAKRFQLLIAALVLAACGSALALESSEEQTVLQALQAQSEEFTTFLTMVEQAGLTESLSGEGPITVLAPTNAAFADMDANALTTLQSDADQAASFLNGLIIPGSYLMTDLEQAQDGSLAPLSGEAYEVEMTAGGLTVNGVSFAATDVDNVYANGVVHVTNGVVLPQALRAAADAEPAAEGATAPVGQADPTAPAAPAAPGTAPEPAESQPTTAFVRVVQLSPNSTVDVVLTPQEEGLTAIDLSGLEYMAGSGYQEIQPGTYLVSATLPDSQDALFDAPNETFDAGNYYTVAISGLQVSADADDTEEA